MSEKQTQLFDQDPDAIEQALAVANDHSSHTESDFDKEMASAAQNIVAQRVVEQSETPPRRTSREVAPRKKWSTGKKIAAGAVASVAVVAGAKYLDHENDYYNPSFSDQIEQIVVDEQNNDLSSIVGSIDGIENIHDRGTAIDYVQHMPENESLFIQEDGSTTTTVKPGDIVWIPESIS